MSDSSYMYDTNHTVTGTEIKLDSMKQIVKAIQDEQKESIMVKILKRIEELKSSQT